MKAPDGTYVTGWLASQTDMLADDCNRVLFLVLVEFLDFLDLHVVSGNLITRAKHKKHSLAVPTLAGNLLTVLEFRNGVAKG